MDKVSKMKASLSKGLKPQRDILIPTAPSTEVAYSKPPRTSAYTKITTLPLSKEQKALIEDLGTKLQRQKPEPKQPEPKQPGLNWKSILRGMIGLLDEHTFDGVSVANEEELHQVIKKKFGR
jgi:hypothetical protein